MRLILSLLFLTCCFFASAQKETSNWFFSGNWLKVDQSGVTNISSAPATTIGNHFLSTSVSDASGNLLFLSDGNRIYNKNLQLMAGNATEFHGSGTVLLTAPFPGSPSKHYVFYTNQVNSTYHLKYAVVDMAGNSGMGSVASVNNLVDTGLSRGFTLNYVPNSDEFWLIAHRYKTDTFLSTKVTSAGLGSAIKTRAGSNGKLEDYRFEELKTSPNGNYIAGFVYADYTNIFAEVYSFIEVFNFNAITGQLFNKVKSTRNFGYFGSGSVEFSPDSRLLYLLSTNSSYGLQPCDFGSSGVGQFNLCYADSVEFTRYAMTLGTTFSWCSVQNWGRMELGADRKMHMPYRPSHNFSSVNFPNRIGSSANVDFGAHTLLQQVYANVSPTFNHRNIAKAVINNISYSGGCFPSPTQFEITSDTIGAVQWNFGDAASGSNTSGLLKPSHTFSAPGIYTVTAKIFTTSGKLIETLEEKVEIKDPGKRLLSNFPKDTSFCEGGTFKLKVNAVNAIFRWTVKEPISGAVYDEGVSDSISITGSGIYYVEMRQGDCDGCRMFDSIKVNVIPRPYTFLGYPRKICGYDSLKLEVYSEGADYVWNTGQTGTNIWVKQPGTYWVQGEFNNSGCFKRDSIVITAAPAINFQLPADTSICENETLQLKSTLNNAYHVWNNNYYGNTFNVTTPGQVTLRISDANGCYLYDTMHVAMVSSPYIFAGNDTTVCENNHMQLNATSTASGVKWNTGSTSSFINVQTSGSYIVETTGEACVAKDTIEVTFSKLPDATLGADRSICQGEQVTLSTVDNEGSFLWSTGNNSNILTVSSAGNYWVRRNINGCVSSDTVMVIEKPFPTISLGNDTALCEGNILLLDASYAGATYIWQDGSGLATYEVKRKGTYTVEVNIDGCKTEESVNVTYTSVPSVNLGNDLEICPDQKIILDPLIRNADMLWQDGSTESTYTVTNAGKYSLKATNACGTSSDEIVVTQGMCKLAIPNAFTPNNDGRNDMLIIANPSQIKTYFLQIFNRWGQLVFTTTDPYKGWNGRFNGLDQPEGNYLWAMSLTDINGNVVSTRGSVLLIR